MSRQRHRRPLAETQPPDHGATAVEYSLLLALIAGVLVGVVGVLGVTVAGLFGSVPGF